MGGHPFHFQHCPRRKIAVKFCYSNWGMIDDPTPLPTVKEALFRAFAKARLVDPPMEMRADKRRCECSWPGRLKHVFGSGYPSTSAPPARHSLHSGSTTDLDIDDPPPDDDSTLPFSDLIDAFTPADPHPTMNSTMLPEPHPSPSHLHPRMVPCQCGRQYL